MDTLTVHLEKTKWGVLVKYFNFNSITYLLKKNVLFFRFNFFTNYSSVVVIISNNYILCVCVDAPLASFYLSYVCMTMQIPHLKTLKKR